MKRNATAVHQTLQTKKKVKCEKWIRKDHEQWLSQPIFCEWGEILFCCRCLECPWGNIQSVNICWMELIGLHICTKLPADHFTLIFTRKNMLHVHLHTVRLYVHINQSQSMHWMYAAIRKNRAHKIQML